MPKNKIDYKKRGWKPIGTMPHIERRNGEKEPLRWVSQPAVNKNGKSGILWWYIENPDAKNGNYFVKNWDNCHDITVLV